MDNFNLSFNRCWDKYEQSIFSLCLQLMSKNLHDAQDAKSEIYLRASKKFNSCRADETDNKQWFLKVARHVCFDIYRYKQREQQVMECFSVSQNQKKWLLSSGHASPENKAISQQNIDHIINAINSLPKNLRHTMTHYAIYEKPYRHISKDLDISESNARKRVQLARKILHSSLN